MLAFLTSPTEHEVSKQEVTISCLCLSLCSSCGCQPGQPSLDLLGEPISSFHILLLAGESAGLTLPTFPVCFCHFALPLPCPSNIISLDHVGKIFPALLTLLQRPGLVIALRVVMGWGALELQHHTGFLASPQIHR